MTSPYAHSVLGRRFVSHSINNLLINIKVGDSGPLFYTPELFGMSLERAQSLASLGSKGFKGAPQALMFQGL